MAILNQTQLVAASNATYFDNTSGSITPTAVRTFNDSFISSSIVASVTSSMVVASASWAGTSSFALNFNPSATASYALQALNATNASNADQATFASTAGSANSAITASFALNFNPAATASYAINAATASFLSGSITNAVSASYALSASFANNALTASFVVTAQTSSFATLAQTASKVSILDDNGNNNHKVLFVNTAVASNGEQILIDPTTTQFTYNPQTNLLVVTASLAQVAQTAQTASYVVNAISASYAANADLLDGLNFTAFTLTSSFTPFSSSVSDRLTAAPTLAGNNTFTGNNVFGNVTASRALITSASVLNLYVLYETASVIYSSGSNQFGDAANDVQTLWGQVTLPSGPLNVTGSIATNQPLFINNSYVNINGGGIAPNTNNAGDGSVVVLQMASTQSVGWNMFIDDTAGAMSYDQVNFIVESGQGAKFQDANGVTYALETWLQIPSNGTGTNPAPQFTRGLQVTGSLSAANGITGSLLGTATTALTASSVSTLVQPVIITGSLRGNITSASIASSTSSLDFSLGNFYTSLVSGSTNFNITNPRPGQTVNLLLSTVGVATASFSSNVKQVSGSSYTPTSGSGKNDILTFISWDGTSVYLANVKNLI